MPRDTVDAWNEEWLPRFREFLDVQMHGVDAGHGIEHVQRVVNNAIKLADGSVAQLQVILPAAWLHDCVSVPKNSPMRSQASRLAAAKGSEFLTTIGYEDRWISEIKHCIEAHSFSAGIPCTTIEAEIVQDADRLEALGAIGLARCLMTGGSMGQRLYEPIEPFPVTRLPRDTEQSVDHFFAKLLGLHETMKTSAGRTEAVRRTEFLKVFLRELAREIGTGEEPVERAIRACAPSR
ncbi:MAG: HD domain-containing protein [Pirellula sp.]|jgi:uncharacterized protein